LERRVQRQASRSWKLSAERVAAVPVPDLRVQVGHARSARAAIDRFVAAAEARLDALVAARSHPPRQPHADWVWRPDAWSGPLAAPSSVSPDPGAQVAPATKLFHDARLAEVTVRQLRERDSGVAPFGLAFDVLGFDGSFLSLAIDLPEEAAAGMRLTSVVSLETVIRCEARIEVFARLNIRHGPNTEQLVVQVDPRTEHAVSEFDLAYTKLNEKRVERAWLDLILERPAMNRIEIAELTLCRRPRAAL
jgi:hypothetical protein